VFHAGEINFPESPSLGFHFATATTRLACSLRSRLASALVSTAVSTKYVQRYADKQVISFFLHTQLLFPPQTHIKKSRFGESVAAKRNYNPVAMYKILLSLMRYYF
jgi:hypothetical protein